MTVIRSLLDRLLGRPSPAPERPPSPRERTRLEHRARSLRREIKSMEKALGYGCSTCVKQEVNPARLRVARKARELRAELVGIETRLAQ